MVAVAPALDRPRGAGRNPAVPWDWLEYFVLVLFLSTGLLFLPGAQMLRMPICALPYASSLGLCVVLWNRPRRAVGMPGKGLLVGALGLMALNIAHPGSNLLVGIAQLLFQLTIAAPVFWVDKLKIDSERLERVLNLIFVANALSCSVGLLQVLAPEHFMPPEFSRLGLTMDSKLLRSLSYRNQDGTEIIRPPGLTDMPGGAALGSAITAMLGLMLAAQPGRKWWLRGVCLLMAGAGLLTLYMTQVRSLLLVVMATCAVLCFLLARLGRLAQATALACLATGLVIGSFLLAWMIGGNSVLERFYGIVDNGVVESYQSNRGIFLEYTLTTLLDEYPFGAGIGRWGMMFVYFSPYEAVLSPQLWAEIQVTGWLYDGGVPLILLYLAAIGAAMAASWRGCSPGRLRLGYLAAVIFCLQLFTVGQSFAGPTFNATPGIQFWLLTAALHQAGSVRPPRTILRSAHTRTQAVLSSRCKDIPC